LLCHLASDIQARVTRWGDLSPKGRQNEISGGFKKSENRPFFRRQKGRFWVKESIVKYLVKLLEMVFKLSFLCLKLVILCNKTCFWGRQKGLLLGIFKLLQWKGDKRATKGATFVKSAATFCLNRLVTLNSKHKWQKGEGWVLI